MTVISSATLNAVSWVFTGLAVLLTAGRQWIRLRILRRFDWNDAAHLAALLLLLVQVSMISGAAPLMYRADESIVNNNPSQPDLNLLFRINLALLLITWSCLYAVKVSFLLFYRTIFNASAQFNRAWWSVLAFVILSYCALIISSLMQCGGPSAASHIERCNTPSNISFQKKFLLYSYIFNVFSDLATMALPLGMLKGLKLPLPTKLGLASIFSCAFLVIAFDTIRVVETLTEAATNAFTPLWTNTESAISVIVSCMPSFVALLKTKRNSDDRCLRHQSSLETYPNKDNLPNEPPQRTCVSIACIRGLDVVV